jgi:hypothetical protein
VVRSLRRGIRGEVQQGGVCLRLPVPTFVIDKSAEVGSKLGPECAIGIDEHGLALLVQQVVLAPLDVEPESWRQYEYLCGC